MSWQSPFAPTDAELAACVQCGLCLPHCPTFRLTGSEAASPRGRLMAMAAVAEGVAAVDATFEDMMTFCLQCRACEAVCPSLVPFGRAMEGARTELAVRRPSWSGRFRRLVTGRLIAVRWLVWLATGLAALGQRLRAGRFLPGRLASGLAGLRRLPVAGRPIRGGSYPPEGAQAGVTAGLLAGCVMEPWFGPVHEATIGVLRRAGYRVDVPDGQTCCGALAAHDGAERAARRLAAVNLAAFAGADVVVTDAAGCGAHLREYGTWVKGGADLAARVKDVTELVAEAIDAGLLPVLAPGRGTVAIQDPCHLRHAQRVTAPPRRVLEAAGYAVVEIDEDGLCCGAAGLYGLTRPETSGELGRRKAAQVRTTGATAVASANPGCEMQLRAHLGDGYRVVHPVELYWEALDGPGGRRAG